MASIGPRKKPKYRISSILAKFWRAWSEITADGKHDIILCLYRHCTVYIPIQRSLMLIQRSRNCHLCTALINNQGQKLKNFERYKRFRVKSCRSISFPVKNMASMAPRGHITTGIFSIDKVYMDPYSLVLNLYFRMMCFTLPVLVILMALGTVSRAEDPCHIWGTDIPGDDIRYINNMKDLSQCRLKCSEEKRSI